MFQLQRGKDGGSELIFLEDILRGETFLDSLKENPGLNPLAEKSTDKNIQLRVF